MSIKTIAVDTAVYEKLARIKGASESFSKALDRLTDQAAPGKTGAAILERLARMPAPLTGGEAAGMGRVVAAHRKSERWKRHDLR